PFDSLPVLTPDASHDARQEGDDGHSVGYLALAHDYPRQRLLYEVFPRDVRGKPLAYQRASVFRRSSSRSVTRPSPSADSLGRTILGSVSGGKWRIRTTSSREYAHFQASRGHVLRHSEHY